MIRRKRFYALYKGHSLGPGGECCPCCAPSPRLRKKFHRWGKKTERNVIRKEMLSQLSG